MFKLRDKARVRVQEEVPFMRKSEMEFFWQREDARIIRKYLDGLHEWVDIPTNPTHPREKKVRIEREIISVKMEMEKKIKLH